MPLSDPAPREHIHTREIICHAYEREDGLFDLDAHLSDVKTYDFPNQDRGGIKAGEPLHGMWLRLTIDTSFVIKAVEAKMDHTPYHFCKMIEPDHQKLVGLQIGAGWNRKVREVLGGTHGCTHLREMLGRMATVAFQSVYSRNRQTGEEIDDRRGEKPWVLDGCHTWSSDSPVVKREYPDWYTGPVSEDAAE